MEYPITMMYSGVVIQICRQKIILVFSLTQFWLNAPTANLPGLPRTEDASKISTALKINTSSSENALILLINVSTSIYTEEGARNVPRTTNWSTWKEGPNNANSFNPLVEKMSMSLKISAKRK